MVIQNLNYLKTLTVEQLLQFYDSELEATEYFEGKNSEEYAIIMSEKGRFMTCLKDIDMIIEETKTYQGNFELMYLGREN